MTTDPTAPVPPDANGLREAVGASRGLETCGLDHGGEANPARVYGHHGSPRTCIRIKATNEWVYDPAWENTNG